MTARTTRAEEVERVLSASVCRPSDGVVGALHLSDETALQRHTVFTADDAPVIFCAALTALAATAASLIAPRLWGAGGLGWVTSASAASTILATLLLWLAATAARTQQKSPVLPPPG